MITIENLFMMLFTLKLYSNKNHIKTSEKFLKFCLNT